MGIGEPLWTTLPAGPQLTDALEGLGELFRLPMALALTFGLGIGTIFTFLPTFGDHLGAKNLALFYTGYAGSSILVRATGGSSSIPSAAAP